MFFVVVKAHVGRAKLLLSRRSFEPLLGLGRSLALPGMRLRAENSAEVCSWTFPLTPDPSHPLGGEGRILCLSLLFRPKLHPSPLKGERGRG